jgi:hypothetical protein
MASTWTRGGSISSKLVSTLFLRCNSNGGLLTRQIDRSFEIKLRNEWRRLNVLRDRILSVLNAEIEDILRGIVEMLLCALYVRN